MNGTGRSAVQHAVRRPAAVPLVCLCCLLSLGAAQAAGVSSMVSPLAALDDLESIQAQLERAEARLGDAPGNFVLGAGSAANSKAAGTRMDVVKSAMTAAAAHGEWDKLVPLVDEFKSLRAAGRQASLAEMGGLASPPPADEPVEAPADEMWPADEPVSNHPRVFIYDDHVGFTNMSAMSNADKLAGADPRRFDGREPDTDESVCSWGRFTCFGNPMFRSPRGAMAADLFVYLGLRNHKWRTRDPSEADVFYIPAMMDWSAWLRDGQRDPLLKTTHAERMQAIGQHVMSTQAFKEHPEAHLVFGAAEFAHDHYKSGGKFLTPADSVKTKATIGNQEEWGDQLFAGRVQVPYMGKAEFLTMAIRRQADQEAKEEANSREKLLFFKGTLGYGEQRSKYLLPLKAMNNSKVVVSFTDNDEDKGASVDYEQHMLQSTFCVHISGHSCTTCRLYDMIAAGCIPVLLDCNGDQIQPYKYSAGTYTQIADFSLFYPGEDIREHGAEDLISKLEQMPMATIKELRLSMKQARQDYLYGWTRGLEANVSLDDPDSGLAYGRVGERAVMDLYAQTSSKWKPRDLTRNLPFTKSFR
jgi:hypothetical protein